MPESIAEQERRRLWRLAGMGGTLASEILAAALIGWGLDALFGTKPTLLIICTILGVVVGMGTFLRTALQENRKSTRDAAEIAAHLHEATLHEPTLHEPTPHEPTPHEPTPDERTREGPADTGGDP